jgi:hypothetical protein
MQGYSLGSVDSIPLSFTELAKGPTEMFYLAAAEDTPTAYDDGPVIGTALGLIRPKGARYAPLTTDDDRPFLHKTEGLVIAPDDPTRAYLVTDRDDPHLPAQLCEVRLEGPWYDM